MVSPLDRIHRLKRNGIYPLLDSTSGRDDGQPEADFELWEDGDDIPVPKVSMDVNDGEDDGFGPASQTDDYGNMPNANPTSYDRYRGAIEKKAAWEQTRPNISDHQPKLWQRLLAGAAGGAAGYVNAGGRVRVDPKAMESINGSLMRPGYQRDMEKWSDQAGKINAEVDSLGRDMQVDTQQTRARLDSDRAAAYNANQNAQASRARRQEAKLDEKDGWKASSTGHTIWRELPDGTIETKEIEPKAPGRPGPELPAEKTARLLKESREVLGHKDGSDEQKAYLGDPAAKERIRAANRPARVGGRGRAEPRRVGTPGEFNGVRKDKVSALQKLEVDLSKQLEELNGMYPGDGDDPATKNSRVEWQKKHDKLKSDHEAKKKLVMAEYDAGVTGLGGSVVPRQGQPPAAPPAQTPAGPPPGAAIKKRSEAEVRAAAIAARKDPDAVVEAVRKAGGIL
jgi:hypothetical protein